MKSNAGIITFFEGTVVSTTGHKYFGISLLIFWGFFTMLFSTLIYFCCPYLGKNNRYPIVVFQPEAFIQVLLCFIQAHSHI